MPFQLQFCTSSSQRLLTSLCRNRAPLQASKRTPLLLQAPSAATEASNAASMPAAVPRATSIYARTAVAQPSQGAEMTRHGHDGAKPLLVARGRVATSNALHPGFQWPWADQTPKHRGDAFSIILRTRTVSCRASCNETSSRSTMVVFGHTLSTQA